MGKYLKVSLFIFIITLMFLGCNKNDEYYKIDQINYLEGESSYILKTIDDTIYFGVTIWLRNYTNDDISFSIKIIFEDPILKRELGDEIIIGNEIYFEPSTFFIKSKKKSVYGGSFKINKEHLSSEELNKISPNVRVILFDESGYEREIEQ